MQQGQKCLKGSVSQHFRPHFSLNLVRNLQVKRGGTVPHAVLRNPLSPPPGRHRRGMAALLFSDAEVSPPCSHSSPVKMK